MRCKRLGRAADPAPVWHRWLCPDCRAAVRADGIISLGLSCLRAEPAPADGINGAFRAVGLGPEAVGQAQVRMRKVIRRVAKLGTGFLGALLLFVGGWLVWIDRDPNIPVPSPTMPAINAFTYLRDAGSMVLDDKKIGDALTVRKRNARSSGAGGMMGGSAAPGISGSSTNSRDHVYTLDEKAALVAENAPALAKMHEGLKHPYMEPPARSFSADFPHFAKYRGLARLLALDADVKRERGDWAGAMQSCLDSIELGRRTEHGSVLIGKLVGIACEAIGRKPAWDIVDHLSGSEARAASLRLERIRQDRVTVSDTLTEEKWLGMAGLQEMMRQPHWRWGVGGLIRPSDDATPESPYSLEKLAAYVVLLPYSKRAVLRNYERVLDEQIGSARRPYAEQRGFQTSVPPDLVSRVLYPGFSQAGLKDTENETQNALLQVTLALRAYRCDHGKAPQNLAELTPTHMRGVPDDPFAATPWPLRYRYTLESQASDSPATGIPAGIAADHRPVAVVRRGRPVVYSVGPDGRDDQGTPITNPQATSDYKRHQINADSSGDILAGVNRD